MYPAGLHMYTIVSTHAYSILSDYTAEVCHKGIKLFTIIDHGPDMTDAPHHWYFTNMRIWSRVMDGAGVLRGVKANIKNIEGEIDCLGSVFTSLGLVIAGFHGPAFTLHDKDTNTQVMIATMASGNVHIISHPGNSKCPVDIKAIAKVAVKYQVTLEINNFSFLHPRKGGGDSCRAATAVIYDAGSWMALRSDSYTAFTPGEFGECHKILGDVNFPGDRILDAIPKCLLVFLES